MANGFKKTNCAEMVLLTFEVLEKIQSSPTVSFSEGTGQKVRDRFQKVRFFEIAWHWGSEITPAENLR